MTTARRAFSLFNGEQKAKVKNTSELRKQVESALAERVPAAFSLRTPAPPELLPCGVPAVDAALGGGLPLGAITELSGANSSGRTTLALATLAGITQSAAACAYIDVADAFDPLSAAALGIDLRHLLWVRAESVRGKTSWTRLDQALRATDLLLSTGGFRALVLDMGDVPPEQARRVPLATWYRFRLQVEKSRTLFLVITRVACANSCAAVSLHCCQSSIDWRQAAEQSPLLLAGLRYRIGVARSRAVHPTRKKPAASSEAAWSSTASWSR